MDTLKQKLRDFNSHSPNTEDHFKLCPQHSPTGTSYEVRLCSCHPRLITCIPDATRIHVTHDGPNAFRQSFPHDPNSLRSLLALLHTHRDDGDSLIDWELDDWVSAGYPCKMHTTQMLPFFPDLGFMPEDLWCIEEQPRKAAFISN